MVRKVGISAIAGQMDAVDEVALVVRLVIVDLHLGISPTQDVEVGFEGLGSVNAGFASAEEVEIGAVEDEDSHFESFCKNSLFLV